jgi:nucleoside 2-deoxyribosyltransferase
VKIYLCSRVAPAARRLNDKVASYLRTRGYDVFVPHEAPYNQFDRPGLSDEDVYRQDMAEMMTADIVVAVGRVGVDCAFELGWFQAAGVPTVWYTPKSADVGRHPMLYAVTRTSLLTEVYKFVGLHDEVRLRSAK